MLTLLSPGAWKPREMIQTQSVYSNQIKHRGHPLYFTQRSKVSLQKQVKKLK